MKNSLYIIGILIAGALMVTNNKTAIQTLLNGKDNPANVITKENTSDIQTTTYSIDKERITKGNEAYGMIETLSGGSGLLLLLALTLFGRNKKNEKDNEVLTAQKEAIEKQNKEIIESIQSASRIQQAMLPESCKLKKALPQSFVYYKPRDIVSGDFYWMSERDNKVFFAVADCTGHGVQGGFMSMVGNSLLNEAVNEKGMSRPGVILNEVRRGIINSFTQKENIAHTDNKDLQLCSTIKEGMDMALCVWDKKTNILEYAGANNSLYIIRQSANPFICQKKKINPEIILNGKRFFELKANRQPVGCHGGYESLFVSQTVHVEKGDIIYLFSDGYADQFGGKNGKKFKLAPFRELLLSISGNSMDEQKNILEETLDLWMSPVPGKESGYNQIDDICIMGVEIQACSPMLEKTTAFRNNPEKIQMKRIENEEQIPLLN